MNNEITKEELQDQLERQNRMIHALQSEIGRLTGEKIAVSLAYEELENELQKMQENEINEMESGD